MQKGSMDSSFSVSVLFPDEASFSCEGVFNTHNSHVGLTTTRMVYKKSRSAISFCRKCVAGIIGNCLLGFYLLPPRLVGWKYLILFETMLSTFLGAVPEHICQDVWYQHDGARAHSTVVHDYLHRSFGARWISRDRPIVWPLKSPELSPMDFFSGGDERPCTLVDSEMDSIIIEHLLWPFTLSC